ncbi:hypothetical protein BDF14DRAFT_349488 [Spinellus fusiger]|nr:hypothetical protein BDF14DRAFT_349488 [Spinellus fusiger]
MLDNCPSFAGKKVSLDAPSTPVGLHGYGSSPSPELQEITSPFSYTTFERLNADPFISMPFSPAPEPNSEPNSEHEHVDGNVDVKVDASLITEESYIHANRTDSIPKAPKKNRSTPPPSPLPLEKCLDHATVMEALRAKLRRSASYSPHPTHTTLNSLKNRSQAGVLVLDLKHPRPLPPTKKIAMSSCVSLVLSVYLPVEKEKKKCA